MNQRLRENRATVKDLMAALSQYPLGATPQLCLSEGGLPTLRIKVADKVFDLQEAKPVELDVREVSNADKGEIDEWKEFCDELIERCAAVPEAGEEFASGIRERTMSMREWIVDNNTITDKQKIALRNMAGGIDRWIER